MTRAKTTATVPAEFLNTASEIVRLLERVWAAIRAHHGDLRPAIVILGQGDGGKWGHYSPLRWRGKSGERDEVLLAGERLEGGAEGILETLLHEACHSLAQARGVRETSRGNRYHNKRFKALAEAVGLEVSYCPRNGWNDTRLGPTALDRYAALRDEIETVITRQARPYRQERPPKRGRKRGRRLRLACHCDPVRAIHATPASYERGKIVCAVCGGKFAEP